MLEANPRPLQRLEAAAARLEKAAGWLRGRCVIALDTRACPAVANPARRTAVGAVVELVDRVETLPDLATVVALACDAGGEP